MVKSKSLLSAGLIMATGMLLGRVAGFSREIFLAKFFGVSVDADIAVLLLTLPDLIITLLIGGAANIVLIPRFQEMAEEKKSSYFVFLSFWVLVSFFVVASVLAYFSGGLVQILAPGMGSEPMLRSSFLLKWVCLAIPITALTAVSRSYLQSSFRFTMTSIENFLYNIVVILGIVILTSQLGILGVLYSIFVGVLVRWGSQIINILSFSKIRFSFSGFQLDRSLLVPYGQALGAGVILVFLPIMARSVGSFFVGEGAISIFNYSYKLVELPFGVAISVFSIVIFPKLSEMMRSQDDSKEVNSLINKSIQFLVLLSFPITLGLVWFFVEVGEREISFFSISQNAVNEISFLSILGVLVLPLRGLSSMHLAIMSAKRDTFSPFCINVISILLALPGLYFLGERWGLVGVGICLSCLYCIIYFLEIIVLFFKHKIFILKEVVTWQTFKIVMSSLIIYGIFWKSSQGFELSIGSILILSLIAGTLCLISGALFDLKIKNQIIKLLKNN